MTNSIVDDIAIFTYFAVCDVRKSALSALDIFAREADTIVRKQRITCLTAHASSSAIRSTSFARIRTDYANRSRESSW